VIRDRREGEGERGHFCERVVRRGMMAAISSVLASLVGCAGTTWARDPVRPRGLFAMRRPSRIPSKSTVFGGSCFVASAAA
jgi:hypothetical protein